MWLTRFAIGRPVITAMVFIALAVFGMIAFKQIGRSANPPGTDFPIVVVFSVYPGASPQEMERLVVKPIEDQLNNIDNLDELSATAQEGSRDGHRRSSRLGTNLDLAAINVQSAVDTARVYLPADLIPPSVDKNGAVAALLDIAVSSIRWPRPQLADMVNNASSRSSRLIPNVQTVDVFGAADREFHVEPIPERLTAPTRRSPTSTRPRANNANLPGGIMRQRDAGDERLGPRRGQQRHDLLGIPLTIPGSSNKNMKVGDVAYALDSHVEPTSISHFNGEPRIYVELGRNIASDEITATQSRARSHQADRRAVPGTDFNEIDAPADYTQKSLNGVWQSLMEGVVLTMLVMLLFLHAWRNAVVVMIAIPSSILVDLHPDEDVRLPSRLRCR